MTLHSEGPSPGHLGALASQGYCPSNAVGAGYDAANHLAHLALESGECC
jgi:hypothetical protein